MLKSHEGYLRWQTIYFPANDIFSTIHYKKTMSQSNSGSEIDRVIRRMGLAEDWHNDVNAELNQCMQQATDIATEADRTDLRKLPFVTVDGSDAKDFDDAICCEESEEGIILWVAIADVASYVRAGSMLDQEAFKRGNSTYLPDRVLPMLPPLLSNDLCSLLPKQDRPVIACRMVFDAQMQIADYRFSKAIINSHCRLTYQQVQTFFDEGSPIVCCPTEVPAMLRVAEKLYRLLRKSREARGALDLDIPKRHLCFDKGWRIKSVMLLRRNEAHRMIEEFMICANVAAARYLLSQNLCFLSRVHEGIKREALPALDDFLRASGLYLKGTKVTDLARLIEQTSAHESRQIIHTMILSSLQRAIYAPSKKGHFGLALKYYTHFTSPIRRYPDLSVHRAIHMTLGSTSGHCYDKGELKSQGQHCSMTERRSDETVWDIEQYFLCQLAQTKVGQVYRGVVTTVTAFGLFIELTSLQTSGLLHIKYLGDDYYQFNDTRRYLKGVRNGNTYKTGDVLNVSIKSVRADERKIDLVPANF